jgi:hypothetical protein
MDIVQWIVMQGVVVGTMTPLVMAIVKAAEKLGLAGVYQLVFALLFGGLMGAFSFIALNGSPSSVLSWFLFTLSVIMMACVPVGTYEAIKQSK